MLDVHVLVMEYTPQEQIGQCMSSIWKAAQNAGFEVNIYPVRGVFGHLGRSRKNGYSKGTGVYVTHVDDDDYLREDAFSVLKPYLEQGVDAVTTGEMRVLGNDQNEPTPHTKHHLAVYKRDKLEQLSYDMFRHYPDQYVLSRFDPVHIPETVYYHRISQVSGSRRLRRENKKEAEQEMNLIKNPHLFEVEVMSFKTVAAHYDRWLNEPAN